MDWTIWVEWGIKSIILIFILLGGFAYLTLFERRVLARIQVRIGPNRTGPWGILQPIADAVKLIFKEELTPAQAQKFIFLLAPIITVVPAIAVAAVIPWGETVTIFGRQVTLYIADISVGVLYITAITSIAVYGITLAGWSSNNKYALLGGLRASAQMISYELALGFLFVIAIILAGSMNMIDIVQKQAEVYPLFMVGSVQVGIPMWNFVLQPAGALIFLIATLAEVNRAPFDMPEAEQELTAGYHAEYSGMKFALFFMAEYIKMIVISAIAVTLFFGGYLGPDITKIPFIGQYLTWLAPWMGPVYMFIKVVILLFFMVWVRATLPRIRYDRLMAFGWKVLLPLSLALAVISAVGILLAQDVHPALIWLVPLMSIIAGFVSIGFVDRSLRRKAYEVR
jgi:NADH-quinone oxidoreductase subunit H